jgi:hypothetical protein
MSLKFRRQDRARERNLGWQSCKREKVLVLGIMVLPYEPLLLILEMWCEGKDAPLFLKAVLLEFLQLVNC